MKKHTRSSIQRHKICCTLFLTMKAKVDILNYMSFDFNL